MTDSNCLLMNLGSRSPSLAFMLYCALYIDIHTNFRVQSDLQNLIEIAGGVEGCSFQRTQFKIMDVCIATSVLVLELSHSCRYVRSVLLSQKYHSNNINESLSQYLQSLLTCGIQSQSFLLKRLNLKKCHKYIVFLKKRLHNLL